MQYLFLIFLLGAMTPVQTAANSRMRLSVGSPFVASLVSFSIGTIFLLFFTLFQKGSLIIDSDSFFRLPWWAWFGGMCGLWGLTVNILIFPKIGSVQTALMPMIGQISMGMVIDSFGLFRTTQISFGMSRILSLIIILAGICLVILKGEAQAEKKNNILLWQAIGFSGGAVFAMQPPMNSLLSIELQSVVHAAFVSFLTATIMLIAIVVTVPKDRKEIPAIFSLNRPWWSWLGGIIGGIFVTGFAFFASKTGIGILLVTSICGLLTMSLFIDKFDWLGAKKKRIGILQYIGLILVIFGICLLRLA